MWCLVQLMFLLILVNISTQYKIMSLGSFEICSPLDIQTIRLGQGPKSGLIVNSEGHFSLTWHDSFYCEFKIDAGNHPSGSFLSFINKQDRNGIFTVIQKNPFRKNEKTGQCIDYVQFTRGDGSPSRQFCGTPNEALGTDLLSFDSNYGNLEVTIFISKDPLPPGVEMDISIVFTLYNDCQTEHDERLQPCSENFPDKCIHKEFFKDHYINCPYPNCVDEDGCPKIDLPSNLQPSDKSNILLVSLSPLLLVLAISVCCFWVLYKRRLLCWSENFTHLSSVPLAANAESQADRNDNPIFVHATAPAPEDDSGSPPSYDSLFLSKKEPEPPRPQETM